MVGTTNLSVRNAWLESVLKNLPNNARILDAGAGELANKKYCSHLNYVSQDLCEYEGTGDTKGLQTGSWDTHQIDIISDIASIPEENSSFDIILCSEVFEHLPDPMLAMREFQRLLKPGGILILTAPFNSLTHFAPYHYSSGFNRYYYEINLDQLGFDVVELTANGNYFEYIAQELRRLPSIAEQYATKKISRIERIAINMLLKALSRFSANDHGSNELLCFGYHVVAKKR